ncbi:MAG: PQQ-binding-like beta-propeller repeat protein, partial [Planctomycetota bacterium]
MNNVTKLFLAIPAIACMASIAKCEDWPTFRGADRTSISNETGIMTSWPSDGPELVWTAKGAGRGYASPAIAGGKVFTLGDNLSTKDDKDEYLICFDLASGDELWTTKTGEAWDRHKQVSWNGSRATPTVDGDLVYVISPFGKLFCAQVADGSIVWQKDFKADFGGKKKDSWGYGESPLIDGEMLICTPGGSQSTVVALNKKTGEKIWNCSRPDDVGAGHSSVVISNVGGKKVYVQNTGMGPMGIDAATGEMLWDFYMKPPIAFIPTPIIDGDYVFSVAGYGLGAALVKQVVQDDGSIGIEEIYGPKTSLGNKHGGVILIDGKIYGGREDKSVVYCADMLSGEVIWEERGGGERSTSVISA